MAGYSKTPLAQKLGIKPGTQVAALNPPSSYRKLLAPLPAGVSFVEKATAGAGFVHLFVAERRVLERELKRLRSLIDDTGILWISWPKKSAGLGSDITEDVIREVCLPLEFVDIKVCAIDDTWSGLKLMIRRENRTVAPPCGAFACRVSNPVGPQAVATGSGSGQNRKRRERIPS